MKTTKMTVIQEAVKPFDGDLLIFFSKEIKKGQPDIDPLIEKPVSEAYDLGDFKGAKGEKFMFYPSSSQESPLSAKRVLVIGLGPSENENDRSSQRELLRETGGEIAKQSETVKAGKIMLCLPAIKPLGAGEISECLAEGILLGDYRFTKYKKTTKKDTDYKGLNEIIFSCKKELKAVQNGMNYGSNAAFAACEARNMANEPGNSWTADNFAAHAEVLSETYGFKLKVLGKTDMQDLGMGGILAVNKGSAEPPQMVILTYDPPDKTGTILLVGKGITFDSGGVSLKTAEGMADMKYDMSGGAAVLCVMEAVGREKPSTGVVAIIPATDNMGGSSAVKPGDVIRHYNGVTSEIINTDAEGRMILGDAISYGIEIFKPDCVIDIATLTGAIIFGLGHHYSGLFSNNDELAEKLVEAAKLSSEPLWRMPLGKEYSKQIESKVADIKNVGGKPGGSITAAAYLENFVGDTPWAHIDIAGTAWDFTEKSYIPKGPSGFGVRILLTLIRQWKGLTSKA